jgi:hypothetical protein
MNNQYDSPNFPTIASLKRLHRLRRGRVIIMMVCAVAILSAAQIQADMTIDLLFGKLGWSLSRYWLVTLTNFSALLIFGLLGHKSFYNWLSLCDLIERDTKTLTVANIISNL